MSRKAAHNPVLVDRRPVKMQGRANIGPGAAGYPSDADCDMLRLGDVARLRRRTRTLSGSDDAPQSLKELLKKKGTGAIDVLGKVEMCELLRKGGRLTDKRRVRTEYTYADIQVKDAPLFSICPVTHKIMVRPATLSSGTTLEHSAAIRLLAQHDPKDPLSGVEVDKGTLIDNRNLALAIRSWAEQHFSLKGREIDPESPAQVAERKKQEADEKERARESGVNVGSVTGTDVDRGFASMNRNKVYRRLKARFVEGAYFSARWDFGGGGGELADELHLVRDGAKSISATWGGIDERWEVRQKNGRGDVVRTVGTESEIKTLLAFLADKGTIDELICGTVGPNQVFTKASWPEAEWTALTPQRLDEYRTVKLIVRHIGVDSMESLAQVPNMVWNRLVGEGVAFIEKLYDGWYIRTLFGRRPAKLLDDSRQIVRSSQLLDILRAMHNANVLDLVILDAPGTFGISDVRDDLNASVREQVRVNTRVEERVAQERLRANAHADSDSDNASADSDDAKSNGSDDTTDVDRRRVVQISEYLRHQELRLLARNTGPVTPADIDEIFAHLGTDPVYRRLTVQFVEDPFFSSRWADDGRTIEFRTMLSFVTRGVSGRGRVMSTLWLGDSDWWEVTFSQGTMVTTGRILMALLRFLAAEHIVAGFWFGLMGDEVAFQKDSWSEAAWDTITPERLLELGTIMVVLSAVADDAVQPAAVPDEIWNVVTTEERVFFLYYSPAAAAAAPASAAVDGGGGRWLLRRPGSMRTQPLGELVQEEPLALLDALHRFGFIDILILGAPLVF